MDENRLKSVCRKEADSVRPGKVFCVKMQWRIFKKGVGLYLARPAAQFKFATSFGLIIVMMSGGVSAYAYDSPEVNASSFLYPVKQGLEGVERQFRFEPEDQIRFHVKIAKRRLSETETMRKRMEKMREHHPPEAQRLNEAIERTMEYLQSEVDRSFDLTDTEMSPEKARLLLRDMRDDFALMHNHMEMMNDGETLEKMRDKMKGHLESMQEAVGHIDQVAPHGKKVRLREILIIRINNQ